MNSEEREALAKRRFILLNVARFSGVFMVMLGIAISLGKLLTDFPPVLGSILMVLGMFEFFFLPIILKKSWAKEDEKKK